MIMPNGDERARADPRGARMLRPDLKVLLTSGYSEQFIKTGEVPRSSLSDKPYRRESSQTPCGRRSAKLCSESDGTNSAHNLARLFATTIAVYFMRASAQAAPAKSYANRKTAAATAQVQRPAGSPSAAAVKDVLPMMRLLVW